MAAADPELVEMQIETAPALPEHLETRRRHIEEVRQELLNKGGSAEDVANWLQPHVEALAADVAALGLSAEPET